MPTPPVKYPLPATDNATEGDVVAIPNLCDAVNTDPSAPEASYISIIFAVPPDAGRSARVVVAALPERTVSFAYGVVVAFAVAPKLVVGVYGKLVNHLVASHPFVDEVLKERPKLVYQSALVVEKKLLAVFQ